MRADEKISVILLIKAAVMVKATVCRSISSLWNIHFTHLFQIIAVIPQVLKIIGSKKSLDCNHLVHRKLSITDVTSPTCHIFSITFVSPLFTLFDLVRILPM